MSDDPYAALGVARTASARRDPQGLQEDRQESHPDLNPGDPKAAERFKAASAAHDLLKDAEKRARFDRGEIDASGQERPERRFYREYAEGPEATYHTSRGFEDFGDFSDVFADLFGQRGAAGGGARRRDARPSDARPGRPLHPRGRLPRGRARRDAAHHPADGGVLDVKIPEGLADGQTIRLRGKGGPGFGGGPAGDALVTVTVGAARLLPPRGRRHPGASCRSPSTRRCSAARSRCRPSTAASR